MGSSFLSKKWKKIKEKARLVKIANMKDQKALKNIALDKGQDVSERILAVLKVTDPDVLAEIALDTKDDPAVRCTAIGKIIDFVVLNNLKEDESKDYKAIHFSAKRRISQLKRQNIKPSTL
ncbi:MAG: hypothetical protein KAI76_08875 [Alphaproteobacteria bacterium]|nr:hypothetical protein [Alphaproteobacteria bacterium]